MAHMHTYARTTSSFIFVNFQLGPLKQAAIPKTSDYQAPKRRFLCCMFFQILFFLLSWCSKIFPSLWPTNSLAKATPTLYAMMVKVWLKEKHVATGKQRMISFRGWAYGSKATLATFSSQRKWKKTSLPKKPCDIFGDSVWKSWITAFSLLGHFLGLFLKGMIFQNIKISQALMDKASLSPEMPSSMADSPRPTLVEFQVSLMRKRAKKPCESILKSLKQLNYTLSISCLFNVDLH